MNQQATASTEMTLDQATLRDLLDVEIILVGGGDAVQAFY